MRTACAAAAVTTTALLAACGDPAAGDPSTGRQATAGEVVVLVSAPQDAGMDALGGGTVEVVGNCLGADGTVVIWPHGTEVVTEDPLVVDVPEIGRVALGDVVELTGGFVFEPSSGPAGADPDPRVPPECTGHPVFLAH
ncbi:hypothetical protein A7K94_0215660 [Modestobacter sp. VKM Ac-2676]|nr:hypothetical protein A7K94_0215660 [Modestobacter sp. VKM Ac-2676]